MTAQESDELQRLREIEYKAKLYRERLDELEPEVERLTQWVRELLELVHLAENDRRRKALNELIQLTTDMADNAWDVFKGRTLEKGTLHRADSYTEGWTDALDVIIQQMRGRLALEDKVKL